MAALAAAVALIGTAILLLVVPGRDGVTKAAASTAPLPVAVVSVSPTGAAETIPRSYFGLSTEYWALPIFERQTALFERVLALLHASGDGPLVLRIGGDSADYTYWDPGSGIMPAWVFRLTPDWLSSARTLVRGTGAKLIIDLNVITGSPWQAGEWAQAAERELPRGSIVGFEIGNEDDIYSRSYWRATIATKLDPSFLPDRFSPSTYIADFQSYARVLARVAPHVPLLGPALANPATHVQWISSLLASPHPGLEVVSAHRYPFSACVSRSWPSYPTISRLLTAHASAGMAQSLVRPALLAHRAGLKFRLTELNSVTCGGLAGVSNSFATALWAPDSLFALLRAGVDGVNLHVRANTINAPFAITENGLVARPLLYGLMLFNRTLGPGAQLLPVRLQAKPSLHVSAWLVRLNDGTAHVLLIDESRKSVRVDVRLPAAGHATVQRLLAPSVSARSGVTLAGQRLSRDGSWLGSPSEPKIAPARRGYWLTVRRESAALLTVPGPTTT